MKKTPRVAQPLLLGVFAILASVWGVEAAHAETISLFSGSWRVESTSEKGAAFQNQSAGVNAQINSTLGAVFSFDGTISNYVEQGSGCDIFNAQCLVSWSGDFSGGTVSFGACCGQTGVYDYSFKGVITGGSFEGEMFCDVDDCLGENRASFSFISTSSRFFDFSLGEGVDVWSSKGSLSVGSCVGFCGGTFGTLTMTTSTVPEPVSAMLLGAGIAAVEALRRGRCRGAVA